jgi:two-component system nitrate/nitrite response regulator NarL
MVTRKPAPRVRVRRFEHAGEREIAGMVMRGLSNREIAAARGTSENTVANQLKAIFRKLGVASRIELVRLGR